MMKQRFQRLTLYDSHVRNFTLKTEQEIPTYSNFETYSHCFNSKELLNMRILLFELYMRLKLSFHTMIICHACFDIFASDR